MAAHTATTTPLIGTRIWSRVLAVLVSLSLVVSLFHCCCVDGEDETSVSVVQTSDVASLVQIGHDASGKTAPCSAPAHCCHCLAHVVSVAPQDDIASIVYVTRRDRIAAAPAPDAADLATPFKPPRA